MKNLFLKNLLFFLLFSLNVFSQDGKFTFTLTSNVNTSAGVYKSDGTMVRTLWNNVRYPSGTHTEMWDGKDDAGVKIASPDAAYQIKVLTNNVVHTWQGTIGNTSDNQTGPSKHRGYYHCMTGLAFGPTYGYFSTGYSEGSPSIAKFNIATPNQKILTTVTPTTSTPAVTHVATDGVRVYWGAFDAALLSNTFVFGTNVSNDAYTKFSNGVSYTPKYQTALNTISYVNANNSHISGMAVQKSGNFLFVARQDINQLQVLDKTTGELLQTLSFTSPRGLSVDKNDELWMATGTNQVSKYGVNHNGTLTGAQLSLTGLVDPLATQVSFDGTLVSVADGKNSNQVKFYNSSNGSATSTLGVAGGYMTDPTVTDNKFYFTDVNGSGVNQYKKSVFIAFQPDGSFWVNDPGNFRVQHYNSNRNYIDRVMSLGAKYSVFVDKNNIKKVFADYLEFEVDYSVQTPTGTSGWNLKRNWGGVINSNVYDGAPRNQTTLSNGRTYGLIRKLHSFEVIEFMASGQLRFTGIIVSLTKLICGDGSLQDYDAIGTKATLQRFPLTGFDGSGNPIWPKTGEFLAEAQVDNVKGGPVETPSSQLFSNTDKVVFYNPKGYANNAGPVYSTGYHLGVMKKGSRNKYLLLTELSTHRNYEGPFPNAGFFDVGNRVSDFAGGNVNVVDRSIITSYHGEFWKNAQTNKYNHYYDNGLAIGQFGVTRPEVNGTAAPMMAGNAITPVVGKDANGDLYLYHGDESDHAGVHRWKITNLNSVAEQVVTIPYPSTYQAPAVNYVDLMAGLPFDQVLQTNTAGWTRYPLYENEDNPFYSLWRVKTSRQSYTKLTSNDITIEFLSPNGTQNHVSRDLGNNNVTKEWKVTGEVIFPADNNVNYLVAQQYLEVVDANGKILTSFYLAETGGITTMYGNKAVMASASSKALSIQRSIDRLLPFEMGVVNGVATFTYGNFTPVSTTISDASGNWKTPKTLRIRIFNNGAAGPAYKQTVAIKDFRFFKDVTTAPLVNKPPVAIAGQDITVAPATNTSLNGSGSDPDGTITGYSWRKLSGPLNGLLSTITTATTIITNLLTGVYQYELTVTDNNGAIGRDTVKVTVSLLPPPTGNLLPAVYPANTVNGLDYKYYEGDWDLLPQFSSIAPVKTGNTSNFNIALANRAWQYGFSFTGYIEVPADGQYTFYTSSDDGSKLLIDDVLIVSNDDLHGIEEQSGTIGLKAGKHAITGLYFQQGGGQLFTVSWNGPGIYKQAIPAAKLYRVTVANNAPVANAGVDKSITLPANSVSLTGSGTDTDGTIGKYTWKQLSGPAGPVIVTSNAASTQVTGLLEGVYQYELTVSDDMGAIGKDIVEVTVNAGFQSGIYLHPAVNPSNTVNGLDYKYYEGSWDRLPAFASLNPVETGTVTNFTLSPANRPEQYGFSFTGFINVPADGEYEFSTTSDDGSRLYIDNVLTVDNDWLHSREEQSGKIGLKAGKHAITGLYFQQGGGLVFEVRYSGMGISKRTIPSSELYRVSIAAKVDGSASTDPATSVSVTTAQTVQAAPKMMSVKANDLSVYPNPVANIAMLNIASVKAASKVSISVINILGVQVARKEWVTAGNMSNYKLDLSALSAGSYIITARFDDGTVINKKIIKQ